MIHLAESEIERLIKLVEKYEGNESTLLFPLKETLSDKKEENINYIENFLTAAEYCDDLYEEEYAKVIDKLMFILKIIGAIRMSKKFLILTLRKKLIVSGDLLVNYLVKILSNIKLY